MVDGSEEGSLAKDKPPKKKKGRGQRMRRRRNSTVSAGKRGRPPRGSFPPIPIEAALELPLAIQEHAAGQQIRRLTLFEKLNRSPDSSTSRTMIINSNRYQLTQGGYTAEFLNLTELGKKATDPEASEADKKQALFGSAIKAVAAFVHLYDRFKGQRLPSPEVMRDVLADVDIDEKDRKVCVEVFLENSRFLGLLRTIAGAERLLPIEQVLEEIRGTPGPPMGGQYETETRDAKLAEDLKKKDWKKICFFIAPIGQEGQEERKHSDMMLEALITRALEGEGFEVVRADRIADPGMISAQVIEYIMRSALVIADLSFHNPNVFYELAIRHVLGKPTVHIIRKRDTIPFDVKDFRTIPIDTDDKYDLVAKLETYRAEIATHVRLAIEAGDTHSNPIRASVPNLDVKFT
jgi:hypothetical protein